MLCAVLKLSNFILTQKPRLSHSSFHLIKLRAFLSDLLAVFVVVVHFANLSPFASLADFRSQEDQFVRLLSSWCCPKQAQNGFERSNLDMASSSVIRAGWPAGRLATPSGLLASRRAILSNQTSEHNNKNKWARITYKYHIRYIKTLMMIKWMKGDWARQLR